VKSYTVGHGRRGGRSNVTNMLEGLGMLEVVRHHRVLGWGMRVVGSGTIVVFVFIVITVLFAHEVLGTFVFVRIAILEGVSAMCEFAKERLAATYVLVAANSRIDVARRELIELIVMTEDDNGDVYGAQDGELVSLLEKTTLALEEGAGSGSAAVAMGGGGRVEACLHGAVTVILDGLDLDLAATHGEGQRRSKGRAHRGTETGCDRARTCRGRDGQGRTRKGSGGQQQAAKVGAQRRRAAQSLKLCVRPRR
jgi:hypothetical protein